MLQPSSPAESTIGRLRIIADGIDPLVAQLRLASLLSAAQLHPAGVPPSAVIFIRKLRDPLPRSLRIQQRDIRPPPAWQQAFTAHLQRLIAGAARPARGPVPAAAEAVVFWDRSELLASLASDWCEGRVATCWWWESLLKQGAASQIVKELWLRNPRYVPAALEHLAKANKAASLVNAFGDGEALSLLADVARSFSLNALVPVLDAFSDSDLRTALPKEDARDALPGSQKKRKGYIPAPLITSRGAPWDHWVRESVASELRPKQQILLGLALMLQRAPDGIRAASFAREVETWRRELAFAGTTNRQLPGQAEGRAASARQGSPRPQEDHDNAGDGPTASFLEDDRRRTLLHPERSLQHLNEAATGDGPTDAIKEAASLPGEFSRKLTSLNGGSADGGQTDRQSQAMATFAMGDSSAEALASPVIDEELATSPVDQEVIRSRHEPSWITTEADTQSEQTALTEAQTQTQFGGVFYLINLAIYLGLYGDFTTPAEPGIAMNIWDFIALVGRELIGEKIEYDPAWRLLARLARRDEDDQPGSSFKPEDEWRLPAEWLKPFSIENTVRWSTADGRLRLLHSSGFLVLDVALAAGNPVEQLELELKAYEGFEFRVSSFELSKNSALQIELETRSSKLETSPSIYVWLGRLLPYLRSRLRLALGLKETEDPALLLCRHTARVCATATHIDVFFDLVDLPIAIRFAGLDRDPGWVPAAGRFIAFHFE